MITVAEYPPMRFGYLPKEEQRAKEIPPYISASCNNRTVTIGKKIYRSIVNLLKDHPSVKEDLMQLAHAVNFFANGCDLSVITDPKEFKEMYEGTIQQLSSGEADLCNPLFIDLISAGTRDTRYISEPHYRKDGTFVFYTQDKFVPYKVTCRFRTDPDRMPKITTKILDLQELESPPKATKRSE